MEHLFKKLRDLFLGKSIMSTDEVLKRLNPWRMKNTKPCWIPEVCEGDGGLKDSKFCGTPWIDEDNGWPSCNFCMKQMQFFLQLNLDNLPSELNQKFGSGLLQLFYCTRENCQGEGGWEPFEDSISCVRIINPTREHKLPEKLDPQEEEFDQTHIVDWSKESDLPCSTEHDILGIEYSYSKDGPTHVKCRELNFEWDCIDDGELAETIGTAKDGDKLDGWPYWIQGVEYPQCTICSDTMNLLFQVDSEVNIPFMFGDSGCAHITQCPKHKEIVAFCWACS